MWICVNTVFILISLKTEIARSVNGTKITRAPCRRALAEPYLVQTNFGDLITADHKVVSEGCESRNNHRFAIVWCRTWPPPMDPVVSVQNKTSKETQRSLQKFLEPDRNPKVIYTDNSLEFGTACEDLFRNHCTSTPHRSETIGIAEKSSAQSKRRHLCRIVAIKSGRKLVSRFHGMLYLSARRHRSIV